MLLTTSTYSVCESGGNPIVDTSLKRPNGLSEHSERTHPLWGAALTTVDVAVSVPMATREAERHGARSRERAIANSFNHRHDMSQTKLRVIRAIAHTHTLAHTWAMLHIHLNVFYVHVERELLTMQSWKRLEKVCRFTIRFEHIYHSASQSINIRLKLQTYYFCLN